MAATELPHFDTAVGEQDLQVWLDAMKEVPDFGGSPDPGSLVHQAEHRRWTPTAGPRRPVHPVG